MLSDVQKEIARHLVEDMRPGSEMTLGQLNSVNGLKIYKIYELFEFVHDIMRESPRRYKFSREQDLSKSIIYRAKEYD